MKVLCDVRCLACLLRRSARELEGMSLNEFVGLMRTTEDGFDVVPLSYEVRIDGALLVYDLVLELSLPSEIRMVVDVEIQGKASRRISSRQAIYASGFMLRSLSRLFGGYSGVGTACGMWTFLSPRAAARNKVCVRRMSDGFLEILSTSEERTERITTGFNIRWRDESRGELMTAIEVFKEQYRQGPIEAAEERGTPDGMEKGIERGSAEGCNDIVRKPAKDGYPLERSRFFIPEDAVGDVCQAVDSGFRYPLLWGGGIRVGMTAGESSVVTWESFDGEEPVISEAADRPEHRPQEA